MRTLSIIFALLLVAAPLTLNAFPEPCDGGGGKGYCLCNGGRIFYCPARADEPIKLDRIVPWTR